MNKTLRILAKDARHLWPEILLSIGLTAGYAATDHFFWQNRYQAETSPHGEAFAYWMNILMVFSWWLLITRSVQDESLVGDRQFWTTRPYGWRRILTAKILFIAVFIFIPFFVAEMTILHSVHLMVFSSVPPLLLKLFLLFCCIHVPLIALACITPTFNRTFITFLGLVVYILLVAYFNNILFTADSWTPGDATSSFNLLTFLGVAIFIAVIILQYARRRIVIATSIMVGFVIMATIWILIVAHHGGNLREYPKVRSNERSPFQLKLDPPPNPSPVVAELDIPADDDDSSERNSISLPLTLSGIAPNHAIKINGTHIEIDFASGGRQYRGWEQQSGGDPSLPDYPSYISAELPWWLYHGYRNKPVTVTLTYAVTEYEAEPSTFVTAGNSFRLPEHGYCEDNGSEAGCIYAVWGPTLTRFNSPLQQHCGTSTPGDKPAQDWFSDQDNMFNEEPFGPVVHSLSFLSLRHWEDGSIESHVCPGSPITVTRYHVSRKRLVTVVLPNVDLSQYNRPTTPLPLPIHRYTPDPAGASGPKGSSGPTGPNPHSIDRHR